MTAPTPNIAITYCRLCNWMLRAAWMGQELLSTFAGEAGSLTLIPDDTGGVFEVRIDGNLIWSRSEKGRFPEIAELKQIVRDRIAQSAMDERAFMLTVQRLQDNARAGQPPGPSRSDPSKRNRTSPLAVRKS